MGFRKVAENCSFHGLNKLQEDFTISINMDFIKAVSSGFSVNCQGTVHEFFKKFTIDFAELAGS